MAEKFQGKVLLVDDEKEFLSILAERLKARGLKIITAPSGETALAIADKEPFDLIVLDLAMPGIGGLETLKRLKTKLPEAEIIMLSGQGSIKSSIEAMKLGACDFLQKPVDLSELLTKISEAKDKRLLMLQSKSIADVEKILHSKGW